MSDRDDEIDRIRLRRQAQEFDERFGWLCSLFAVCGGLAVCCNPVCAILGAIVGANKQAALPGFFLGLLFGPFGLIAAFALDDRPHCPACSGKMMPGAVVCPHCNTPLKWLGPRQPMLPQVFAAETARRAHASAQAILESERQRVAGDAWWAGVAALPGRFDAALCRALGEENAILHAFTRLVLYLALPAAIGGAACYWLVAQ